jgi:hypothetical protein
MPIRPALVAVLFLGACGSVEDVRVHAAYLHTSLSGEVAVGPSGGGTTLTDSGNDLVDDLGIEESNPAPLLGASFSTPIGRFGASTFWFADEGSGTLAHDFGDIPRGTGVRSDFEFLNVKTYWVYDVVEERTFRIAPGVAVDFIDMKTEVRSTAAAQAFEQVEVFAPVPMLFLDGEARFGPFHVEAQGGGMRIDLTDGVGTYWDFEGRVGFAPNERIDVFAGYRFLSMDSGGEASNRDANVDLQVQGWFVGGAFRF